MPKQFDKYRMQDGLSPLAASYFNPVWRDVDNRIAALEALGISWEDAIAVVTAQGLLRIDAVLQPSVNTINQAVTDAQAILAGLPDVATNADVASAVANLVSDTAMASAIANALKKPSSVAFTYDLIGNITQQVETLGLVTRTSDYSYDVNGNVATIIINDGATIRTETYTYDVNGNVSGISAVEVSV